MSGLIGRKLGMTSVFDNQGEQISVTVVQAGPCRVVSIKTKEKDGYEVLQLGFGERKEKNISKPVLGQFKKNNFSPSLLLREFKFPAISDFKIGDEIKVDLFKKEK